MYLEKYVKYKNKYLKEKQIGGTITIDINGIKNRIKRRTFTFYKGYPEFIFPNDSYDLKSIMFPLYYLFDNDLNEDIGSDPQIRDNIIIDCGIDVDFGINHSNIINVISELHATLFYVFKYKNNKYFYYSNSGLGTANHITDKQYIFLKLFKISNTFNIIEKLNIISNIINEIKEYNSITTKKKKKKNLIIYFNK